MPLPSLLMHHDGQTCVLKPAKDSCIAIYAPAIMLEYTVICILKSTSLLVVLRVNVLPVQSYIHAYCS